MNDLDRRLKRLMHWARQAPPVPPGDPAPPFLARRVARRFREESNASRAPRWARQWTVLAGTAGLLLGLGLALWIGRVVRPDAPTAAITSPAADELNDLTLLMAGPPVVAIDLSQSAWMSVLVEASEGAVK